MNRRTILRSILFIALAFILTLLMFSITRQDAVEASVKWTSAQTQGSLTAVDADKKPAGECPLKHTAVKAEVSGFLSRVTVTQEFHNPFQEKIEAVYTFPLPESAAVDDLTMFVGDRRVKGKIMRREEAQQAYQTAKLEGRVTSLLEQERPNIFTQSLANIMPGQEVQVTISYVETLKYDEGSYEWVFPMVVAPRYIPADRQPSSPGEEVKPVVPDASRILPPEVSEDMRPGHDISLELSIDAGVPIESVMSETHETNLERPDTRRAIVRLKEQDVIPNKDFVLKYQVAGNKIEDAVLAHRSAGGGFFTLILQPPQRIIAEDVMPKELVFVLDTSGSMGGFPIEKARETMTLALDTLYPHDTFNIITFAGETKILFDAPVVATPENLMKAKRFLSNSKSDGGTEMMDAIRAALEPSDSQHHVRITCFMTDGQVGNDFEIISEVQKHPNARVFAMGFGESPNRFLLDKMAEYGRGEVQYVSETGNTAAVARRFNERIRNPLLTDISVDWSGLQVSDVYPKNIPDLFGVTPVILSGRYDSGARGTIRLKGMMAGNPYVREIPVEFPETQPDHDVLATLWARRRIDDLMAQDMEGAQKGTMKSDLREEVTQLGLAHKLMTQFTSFVAIDELISAPAGDPRRVDVQVDSSGGPAPSIPGSSGISAVVMVTAANSGMLNSDDGSIGVNITARGIQNLPLNGRNFSNFTTLVPGTVPMTGYTAIPGNSASAVNGQRSTTNNLVIDGVSGNFSIAQGGKNPGATASGTAAALTANGGASGLATLSATQEVRTTTQYIAPEFGRVPGAQVSLVTKSGTNSFHGSLFHVLGNDLFDAGDWIANSRNLERPERRLNNFGGTFGGPIEKDKAFFFGSFEGLQLRQPMAAVTLVPSLATRATASDVQPFLRTYPLPSTSTELGGFSESAASYTNPARNDAGSLRVDWNANDRTQLTGRYSLADSTATQRGVGGISLNNTNKIDSLSQTLTGTIAHVFSPTTVFDLKANYSRLSTTGSYLLDQFGGAVLPVTSTFEPAFTFDLNARNARWMTGSEVTSVQRQLNIIGSGTNISGKHEFKFGIDYRLIAPRIGLRESETGVLFNGAEQSLSGIATRVMNLHRAGPQTPIFNNLSLYAQDQWKKTNKLTFTYGLRWELNPAPSGDAVAVNQVDDVSQMVLAPGGTSLWKTKFLNLAPRIGFAYSPSDKNPDALVLRGGLGVLYDIGQDRAGEAFADSFPFLTGTTRFNVPLSVAGLATNSPNQLPISVFDPNLKLPYTLTWNLAAQKSLGQNQTLSVAYAGNKGKRLLNTQTLFDQNPEFGFIRLTNNEARSDYHSMQVSFDRRMSNGLATMVSYTWSKSIDNSSVDSAANVLLTSLQRGPSDFDVRHVLSGLLSYQLPTIFSHGLGNSLFRNWEVNSIFNARSARPVNVVYAFPTAFGFAYLRPDLADGISLYLSDEDAIGRSRINPGAFILPTTLRQGSLGRNSLRGFPFYQVDLALAREFRFTESVSVTFQVDAFNVLNHPNFEDPLANDLSLGTRLDPGSSLISNATFGRSASVVGRSVLNEGGFGAFNSTGGPRALRFSLKLMF